MIGGKVFIFHRLRDIEQDILKISMYSWTLLANNFLTNPLLRVGADQAKADFLTIPGGKFVDLQLSGVAASRVSHPLDSRGLCPS